MNLSLTLALAASSSLILLSGALLLAYLMFLRRCILPFSCCRGSKPLVDDVEKQRGPQIPNARVTDEPVDDAKKESSDIKPAGVRLFKWDEIESLTGGFKTAVIGHGGFSTVYFARLPDSTLTALKVQHSSERLHRAFLQELDVLLHVKHPNIVQLLGYSDDHEEGVLVFEYVPNGTLHDKLHGKSSAVESFPWSCRMSIMFQIASAVDYLHDGCNLQIVHGDITASNVLLDGRLDAKLCDFGCARMGFSATVQPPTYSQMVGSPGYADPHYLRTGIISKKSDVYSFGVLILEMISGIPAVRSEDEKLLTAVMRDSKFVDMVDPNLGTNFEAEELKLMGEIAGRCIGDRLGLRPSMAEIIRIMSEKMQKSCI